MKGIELPHLSTLDLLFCGHRCGNRPEIVSGDIGGATRFVEKLALEHCKGVGIDFGCGRQPLKGAEGVDINGMYKRKTVEEFEDNSLDYVYSSHMMEHVPVTEVMRLLRLFHVKLKDNGIIFFLLPHACCEYWNRNLNPEAAGWHQWVPTYETMEQGMKLAGFSNLTGDPHDCEICSFWITGQKKSATDCTGDVK